MDERMAELREKLKNEEAHDFKSLCELTAVLRGEGGCPWDREQTHESIRNDLIEETYEVIEAIDNADPVLLREELGDVMFQVLFHSRIEEEKENFTIDDVINDICKKMILRHPHVFGDVTVDGAGEVLENWDKIKKVEKNRKTVSESMESVPKQLPALMRAQKIAKKAKKNGFNFGSKSEQAELMKELAESLNGAEGEFRQEIIDEIIFTAAIMSEMDAERGLSELTDRFIDNYKETENET